MGSGAQVVVGAFYAREVFSQDVIQVRDNGLEKSVLRLRDQGRYIRGFG